MFSAKVQNGNVIGGRGEIVRIEVHLADALSIPFRRTGKVEIGVVIHRHFHLARNDKEGLAHFGLRPNGSRNATAVVTDGGGGIELNVVVVLGDLL